MKKVLFRGIAMLCVLQLLFFAGTAHSQERDSVTVGNHKFLYGIHLGYTENMFDFYSTNGGLIASQGGRAHTDGSHSHAAGFRLAVIGEARLGRCFSLRVMPGISYFSACGSSLKSVRAELPLDVKFHPVRMGKLEPYLASGLSYGYDFVLPPNTDGSGLSRHAYFHAGPTFSIGINIEA